MAEILKNNSTVLDKPIDIISEQILSAVQYPIRTQSEVVQAQKQIARKAFEKNGLPGSLIENYRRTDILSALNRSFSFPSDLTLPLVKDIEQFRKHPIYREKAFIIGTVNGKMIPELCILPDKNSGITATSMEDAIGSSNAEAADLFGKITNIETDGYASLNTMLTDRGVFLHVDDHVNPDVPIILVNFIDSSDSNLILHPHNIFKIGENSEIRIIELSEEVGTHPVFRNSVTEIESEKFSRVHYYKLQNFGKQNIHVDNTSIKAKREASINTYTFSFKGKIIRNNLTISLEEEYSEARLYGLYVANDKSLIDNHTVVDHKVANCSSDEKYKGIMDDFSRGVFNGKIYVQPGAQKTNAFQSNHNILLCKTAKIDAKPQLEIWADDVKCTHGCTTGQIDKDQLFYLRARGISEHDARTLLLQAFSSDILDEVTIPFLKAKISSLIKTRLHPKDD